MPAPRAPAFAVCAPLVRAPARAGGACRARPAVQATTLQNRARTALVTGASGGIGAETARGLRGALPTLEHLVLAARNTAKAEAVAGELRGDGLRVSVVPVELGDLAATRACAEEVRGVLGGRPLDLLVNNAGVMACPLMYTKDGLELQYGVNHVAAALLTEELLPELRRAEEGRVVFVSSMALSLARGLDAPPLVDGKVKGALDEGKYRKWACYGESKLAISMYAKALADKEAGLTVCSLHPGVVQTDLGRYIIPKPLQSMTTSSPFIRSVGNRFWSLFGLLTPEEGALMSLELSSASKFSVENGAFYVGPGFQQPPMGVAPMLQKKDLCDKVYESTLAYLAKSA